MMNINNGLLCKVIGDDGGRVGDGSRRRERGDTGSLGAESRVWKAG
ncbi:MAG: hypothetical protein O7C59_12310 [Rickettsia endosymbiont of Ixodes persulcatus]|nr:hypothetical protein [Rickettsia endosymbiont of Ixodes persulcatus]